MKLPTSASVLTRVWRWCSGWNFGTRDSLLHLVLFKETLLQILLQPFQLCQQLILRGTHTQQLAHITIDLTKTTTNNLSIKKFPLYQHIWWYNKDTKRLKRLKDYKVHVWNHRSHTKIKSITVVVPHQIPLQSSKMCRGCPSCLESHPAPLWCLWSGHSPCW